MEQKLRGTLAVSLKSKPNTVKTCDLNQSFETPEIP